MSPRDLQPGFLNLREQTLTYRRHFPNDQSPRRPLSILAVAVEVETVLWDCLACVGRLRHIHDTG